MLETLFFTGPVTAVLAHSCGKRRTTSASRSLLPLLPLLPRLPQHLRLMARGALPAARLLRPSSRVAVVQASAPPPPLPAAAPAAPSAAAPRITARVRLQ